MCFCRIDVEYTINGLHHKKQINRYLNVLDGLDMTMTYLGGCERSIYNNYGLDMSFGLNIKNVMIIYLPKMESIQRVKKVPDTSPSLASSGHLAHASDD